MESPGMMKHHIGWRVPNPVFIGLSWVVVALTWGMLGYVYSSLPATIPSHFGFSGAPDATTVKSFWMVFFPAILQIFLVGLTWWLSFHPQYSNLPSGLTIKLLPEPTQGFVKILLSHMLVMTGLVASLLMAYLSLGMVQISLGLTDRINSLAILGLLALLFLIIGVYSAWLVRLIRQVPQPE